MRRSLLWLVAVWLGCGAVWAQNYHTMSALLTFGDRGDGTLQPGDRIYLTSGNFQRGFAYNPASGNVILVDRSAGGAGSPDISGGIYVLNGTNGAEVGFLSTNGMGGGDFADLAVGVSDDGVVYVGNLVNNNLRNFKLYRWESDTSRGDPIVAFDGVPGGTDSPSQRWGDTMDVRGQGAGTQVLLGSRTFQGVPGTNVAILTTSDGTNFSATVLTTDASDNFGDGIAFGRDNTFWAKTLGRPLRLLSFDLTSRTAQTVRNYEDSNFPDGGDLGPLTVEPNLGLLAALEIVAGTDHVRLYDISQDPLPPILLDIKSFPVSNTDPAAAPGFLDFGPGRLHLHKINDGLLAFMLAAQSPAPPEITKQPGSLKTQLDTEALFDVRALRAATYQWQHNGTNLPSATNYFFRLNNIQPSDAGDYRVIVSNSAGSTTSATAALIIIRSSNPFRLFSPWKIAPGERPYMTPDSSPTGNTPNQRSIAYHAQSNQVILISRSGQTAGLTINVLDASTGADLYAMKTDGIMGGAIILLGSAVAEDGALYAGNMVNPGATAAANFKLYRWENSGRETLPTLIFSDEPASLSFGRRWGDTLAVRGGGANTQILLDANQGDYGALMAPAEPTLAERWISTGFFVPTNTGPIGRSLEFGATNSFWRKRKGGPLQQVSYDLATQTSALIASYTNFPSSLGAVGLDPSKNLLAGVNFATDSTVPDTLALYDITDLHNPILLASYDFPTLHKPNANFIGQVLFVGGRLIAVNGNNGVISYAVGTGGPTNPPVIVTQPRGLRLLVGGSGALSVFASDAFAFQWRHAGTNIPGATGSSIVLTNAQLCDSGEYRVVVSNAVGTVISSTAIVTVSRAEEHFRLSPLWNVAPGSRPYMLPDPSATGNTPLQRSIAYNPLSNHLYLVSRTAAAQGHAVNVLDAATGADLHLLNTDPVGGGNISLLAIAAADDGSIYAANMTTAPINNPFTIYRWADANQATVPVIVFSGDPAQQPTNLRWGDTLAVRGSGTNTELVVDANQGTFAAVLKPVDPSLSNFEPHSFSQIVGGGSIGRSLQFGQGDTIWQKRRGPILRYSSFDLINQTSAVLTNYEDFPVSMGPVAIDWSRRLMAAIQFASSNTAPDTVDLYEISDLSQPLFLGRQAFPVNHRPNANFIGQVVFGGDRLFAISGNNGIVALNLIPPAGDESVSLQITRKNEALVISWPAMANFVLEESVEVGPAAKWTPVSSQVIVEAGRAQVSASPSGPSRFYRLLKP